MIPKSQCSTSPRWITGSSPSCSAVTPRRCTSTLGWNQLSSPSSFTRWRIRQTTSSVVVFPGVITWLEKAVVMISQATSCMRR